MTDHGKAYGENPPTAFPKALEIERTDFHISSAPTTAANLTQFKTRKEPFPVRLTFAPFRLILRLEKTSILPPSPLRAFANRHASSCLYFRRPIATARNFELRES